MIDDEKNQITFIVRKSDVIEAVKKLVYDVSDGDVLKMMRDMIAVRLREMEQAVTETADFKVRMNRAVRETIQKVKDEADRSIKVAVAEYLTGVFDSNRVNTLAATMLKTIKDDAEAPAPK